MDNASVAVAAINLVTNMGPAFMGGRAGYQATPPHAEVCAALRSRARARAFRNWRWECCESGQVQVHSDEYRASTLAGCWSRSAAADFDQDELHADNTGDGTHTAPS